MKTKRRSRERMSLFPNVPNQLQPTYTECLYWNPALLTASWFESTPSRANPQKQSPSPRVIQSNSCSEGIRRAQMMGWFPISLKRALLFLLASPVSHICAPVAGKIVAQVEEAQQRPPRGLEVGIDPRNRRCRGGTPFEEAMNVLCPFSRFLRRIGRDRKSVV